MSKLTLVGKIVDGELRYGDQNHVARIRAFAKKNKDHEFVMVIQAVKDAKTVAQLRFYWGIVIPALCKQTGLADRDEMDRYMRTTFLSTVHEILGERIRHIPSLKVEDVELDKVDVAQYIQNCLEFLWENGGSIPEEQMTTDWR